MVFTLAIAVSGKETLVSKFMRLTFHLSYIRGASTIEDGRGEYQL
jgi:hypothetical protein